MSILFLQVDEIQVERPIRIQNQIILAAGTSHHQQQISTLLLLSKELWNIYSPFDTNCRVKFR